MVLWSTGESAPRAESGRLPGQARAKVLSTTTQAPRRGAADSGDVGQAQRGVGRRLQPPGARGRGIMVRAAAVSVDIT